MPAIFISHGGGPCFSFTPPPPMAPDAFAKLGDYLRGIDASIGQKPKAVLLISGHWEERRPTVNTGARPPMLYDYYGFPEHTYQLKYPAPGSPELAARVRQLLAGAGLATDEDPARGFDHGVFVPLMLIYPEADVPIVQLSMREDFDAAAHIAMGRALAPLRDEGVLIVGSGNSYHNLRGLFSMRDHEPANVWDQWLTQLVTNPDTEARDRQLARWAEGPYARNAQPREDHLIPLMVVAGAAGADVGRQAYADVFAGKAVSGYEFG